MRKRPASSSKPALSVRKFRFLRRPQDKGNCAPTQSDFHFPIWTEHFLIEPLADTRSEPLRGLAIFGSGDSR